MAAGPISERNQDATIYVGGLDEKVTEAIVWELFVQAGPVVNVHMPKDRVTQSHQGYGFVEFLGKFPVPLFHYAENRTLKSRELPRDQLAFIY